MNRGKHQGDIDKGYWYRERVDSRWATEVFKLSLKYCNKGSRGQESIGGRHPERDEERQTAYDPMFIDVMLDHRRDEREPPSLAE